MIAAWVLHIVYNKVKIIAHRGNLNGNEGCENTIATFKKCFKKQLDVEADVWFIDGRYFLGHDKPEERVEKQFLLNNPVWCHAKNLPALEEMLTDNIHCFWHQNDNFTLTSRNYIWTFPNYTVTPKSVIVTNKIPNDSCFGICTDYPISLCDS